MNEVRRYVPRILRDDGMIEAQEVAHYTHLNLSQYVLASDYDALAARVQAMEREIASQDVQMNAVRYRAELAARQREMDTINITNGE